MTGFTASLPQPADDLRTTCLPDHKVARLGRDRLGEYFAPCLLAVDLETDHPSFEYPPAPVEIVAPDGPVVYFIEGAENAIKIGFTKQPVRSRIKSIQNGSPVRLRLLACCSGSVGLERDYHRHFAAHRLHGEWFSPHPDILAEIDRLNANPLSPFSEGMGW